MFTNPGKALLQQCRRPSGLFGRLLARGMNRGHARLRRWGLELVDVRRDARVLDIGCGGGASLGELSRLAPRGRVIGMDLSLDMIEVSRRVNRSQIETGRISLCLGAVEALPYRKASFDTVTAFESTYFWPEFHRCLEVIRRLLVPGGELLIANEVYEHPAFAKRNARWARWAQMVLLTPDGYRTLLEEAGFDGIRVEELPTKNCIRAAGRNPF